MPTVQEGDILLFSQRAVVRHFDSNLNFIQIRSILTLEEYNDWNNGLTNDDGARMGIQVGNEIYVAMPGHLAVGILDLELNRIDTFLNPFRGDIQQAQGAVNGLAYDDVNSILYVCTRSDYDVLSGNRVAIAAYSWPSRQLLWRKAPAYEASVITTAANQAFRAATAWIALSSDRTKLYITDVGYGVGVLDVNTQEFTPLHYLDAVQPTYFSDSINFDDPPSQFPDTTFLHYQPGPPHHFMVLTDGSEGPITIQGTGAGVKATEGNKINTRVFFRYFDSPTNNQPDIGDGQLQLRAMSSGVDNNGKIYIMMNQLASNQVRNIRNHPSAPFFYAIMQNFYSAEPSVVVLNSDGSFDQRLLLPIHASEETDINDYKEGYLDTTTPEIIYGTNQPFSVTPTKDGTSVYAVQIGGVNDDFGPNPKGRGPLTKFNTTTGEVIYKGDFELVPRWAIQELNDGLFKESATSPSYRHVLPITFIAPPVVEFFFPIVTLIGAT